MRPIPSLSRPPRRRARLATILLAICVALIAPTAASGGHAPRGNPAVITTWNAIAVATIAGPVTSGGAGKANAEAFYWFAIVHAAMYNAVVGITREYELYRWDVRGPRRASTEAAAATAAHRILKKYFGSNPTTAANLDAALAASLTQIPDGESKRLGASYGRRAARHIIRLRSDDGRFAPVVFEQAPAPGVWRPTPPAMAPFFDPWLAQVDPFVLRSPDQFRPAPPPAIGSDLYRQEFKEVRDYGAKTGSKRDSSQTETALFFSDIAIGPLQASLRDLVTRRGLDIDDSARLFAAAEVGMADAVIAVWDAKYLYGWWRPITAIREAETDGDPTTTGVSTWEPLIPTPPYPDWPSGLAANISVLTTVLSQLNDDGFVDLELTSAAAGVTRHYYLAATMQQDVVDARVWLGIHFRRADETGAAMGAQIANWALSHAFAPTD